MEDDFTKYTTLYYLIEQAVLAARGGNPLQAYKHMSSIVNWAKERSLRERGRTLLEVLELVESERKNFTDESLYNRIIEVIENRALDNSYTLRQTMIDDILYSGEAITADEEPEELEKGIQNEGR